MAKRKKKLKRGRGGSSLKAFRRSSWRRIRETLGRFLSIMLISAVGIGFFGGVNATGGAMIRSAEMFYEERNLADFRLFSALGFTQENIAALREYPTGKIVMVLDNARIHHAKLIQSFLEENAGRWHSSSSLPTALS